MRRHNQVTYFREPCIGDREGAGEALVAERMGWAIERRKVDRPECRDSLIGRRQNRLDRNGEERSDSAVSENLSTYVSPEPGPGRSSRRPGGSSPGPHREGRSRSR